MGSGCGIRPAVSQKGDCASRRVGERGRRVPRCAAQQAGGDSMGFGSHEYTMTIFCRQMRWQPARSITLGQGAMPMIGAAICHICIHLQQMDLRACIPPPRSSGPRMSSDADSRPPLTMRPRRAFCRRCRKKPGGPFPPLGREVTISRKKASHGVNGVRPCRSRCFPGVQQGSMGVARENSVDSVGSV